MRCEVAREAISARMDGEATQVPTVRIDEHLATCADCQAWLDRSGLASDALGSLGSRPAPDLAQSMAGSVGAPTSRPGHRQGGVRFLTSPAEALRRMWFDAANFSGGALRLSAEVYDTAKILAGSDYPYFQNDKYTRAINYIRDASLSTEVETAILSASAAMLYGDALRAADSVGQ